MAQKVVNSVAWDPDHRGIGHAKSHPLCPLGVVVIMAVGDGGVGDAVEDKDGKHDHRSKELPAEIPEDVWLVTCHLLNTVTESENKMKVFNILVTSSFINILTFEPQTPIQ